MKKALLSFVIVLFMAVGITLLFVEPIQTSMVEHVSQQVQAHAMEYTPEEIQANLESEADFNFEQVQSLSIWDVLEAQTKVRNIPVIGSIYIPQVHLTLPIVKGVGKASLAAGAGTMKPDQVLGIGNYALASHYIEGKDILFGPLYQLKIGDAIFLSDKEFMYEYRTTDIQVVEATDVHIIEDVDHKTLLTLITCAEKGVKRLAVQAELVSKTPSAEADSL